METNLETKYEGNKLVIFSHRAKIAVGTAVGLAGTAVSQVGADIDWANITSIITGMATELIPAFATLVTATVPLILTIAVCGFVVAFLDRILDMIKVR